MLGCRVNAWLFPVFLPNRHKCLVENDLRLGNVLAGLSRIAKASIRLNGKVFQQYFREKCQQEISGKNENEGAKRFGRRVERRPSFFGQSEVIEAELVAAGRRRVDAGDLDREFVIARVEGSGSERLGAC